LVVRTNLGDAARAEDCQGSDGPQVSPVQMFWMWRKGWDYQQVKKFGPHAGKPEHRDGVQSNTE
jgi:hypothetical protein